uniref:Uncharacterized protein n=3 Tax=Meloidogyne TaxID=189290 RepID=A0A6V7UNE3_MELEN|nr:unnamed protein product [Meloidogyne enterolobii]CAD2162168.1 unnamed protein product [Meloidogyne enterolobii]CAD2191391.1 unnamed protein product [Meloidogyne enterolobii]
MKIFIIFLTLFGIVLAGDAEDGLSKVGRKVDEFGQDVSETVNKLSKTEGGQIWCPVPAVGTRCPDSSVFHYFRCCGTLNNECCLKLQTWAFVLLVAVGVLIASLILLSVIRCVFCRRK